MQTPASGNKGPIVSLDVSGVTNMYDIFRDANVFNQDISSWDVSKVTTMSGMFYNAWAFNQDLSPWDVSKVTRMDYMFYSAAFLALWMNLTKTYNIETR